MIKNITSFNLSNVKTNNINRTVLNSRKNETYTTYDINNINDSISFRGLKVNQANSSKEIKELVNLFYDALEHNLEPNKKTRFFDKIFRKILTLPFVIASKGPTSVTETVKSGSKLIGGYSLNIYTANATSHLGFITLAPNVMKTKTGVEALKLMWEKICKTLENNNIKEMTCTTNSKNKPINNLLKKLKAERKQLPFSETEYKISLEQLKNIL